MSWFIAGLGIGFAFGVYTYRWFLKSRKKEEMTTEDCVEMLKNKGYWVRLNAPPSNYKGR